MNSKFYKYERADNDNFNSFQNLVSGQYKEKEVPSILLKLLDNQYFLW